MKKSPRALLAILAWGALSLATASAAPAKPTFKVVAGGTPVAKDANGNYDIVTSFPGFKQYGPNLFETFQYLSLQSGESATFETLPGVANIFARVTTERSYIDGPLNSPVNLYLINSNGITFGQHAQLDVSGSFVATTADVIKFKDGNKFYAQPGSDPRGMDPVLTSAPLSAYGFLGQQSSSIEATAKATADSIGDMALDPKGSLMPYSSRSPVTQLTAKPGQTLSFIAGSIDFEGGDQGKGVDGNGVAFDGSVEIQAPQGRVEMAAVSKGDLNANFSGTPKYGSVTLANANVDSSGDGSGGLAIRAGSLTLSQANVFTSGPLDARVTHAATIGGGSFVYTLAGTGSVGPNTSEQTGTTHSAGNFSIRAGKILLEGGSQMGSLALSTAAKGTKAGRVAVRTGELSIQNGSLIESSTQGGAGAGNTVSVSATNVVISGDMAGQSKDGSATGIFSNSKLDPQSGASATGPSGKVNVSATNLTIQNGGLISGDTFGTGTGGDVNVSASRIKIDAGTALVKTGIFSDSDSPGTGGDGGSVHVTSDSLDIVHGGLISTKTLGSGRGGDTVVNVQTLFIDRGDSPAFTGIAADSATNDPPAAPAHFAGPGGSVHVTADTAYLFDGGQISASTATEGKGGDVFVQARQLVLEGHVGDAFSNISADSRAEAGAGGASGDVNVIADALQILDGARISATTFGLGSAGAVRVQAQTALISSSPEAPFTGILAVSASPNLPGRGGSVLGNFAVLDIVGGGAFSGNTLGPGNGGAVFVDAMTTRLLSGGRISADTSGLGTGGSVNLSTSDLLISTLDGARQSGVFSSSSATGKGGMAGSVMVEADTAKMVDGATISASSTSSGLGGSVDVQANQLSLSGASSIQASATGAGNAGSVTIDVQQPLEITNFSAVRTTSALSQAGTVFINSASNVDILSGSSITVQALTGNAGSISITTTHRLLLQNGQLIAEAGIDGGNILVDPEYIILDDGRISANAVDVGGNILLVANEFLPSGTPVTATGSTAGTVEVSAPPLDLSGALAALNGQFVDASIRFQERCAMRLGGEVSSFLVLGRAGVEDNPNDPPVIISLPTTPEKPTAPQPARKK